MFLTSLSKNITPWNVPWKTIHYNDLMILRRNRLKLSKHIRRLIDKKWRRYHRHLRRSLFCRRLEILPWDRFGSFRNHWFRWKRKFFIKRYKRIREFYRFARRVGVYMYRPWKENSNYNRLLLTSCWWRKKYAWYRTLKHMRHVHKFITSIFPRVHLSVFITRFEGNIFLFTKRLLRTAAGRSDLLYKELFLKELIIVNSKIRTNLRYVEKKVPSAIVFKNVAVDYIIKKT